MTGKLIIITSMILKFFSALDANVCKIKVYLLNFKILCPVFLFTLHHSTFTLIDLLQNYKEPVRKSQEASQESQQNDAHWIHFWGDEKCTQEVEIDIIVWGNVVLGMGILPKNIFKVNIVLVHTVMDLKSYNYSC